MSRWVENILLAALAVFVVLFVVSAWHGGRERTTPEGEVEELTVISPHWEGIRYEFKRAFEAWWNSSHPGRPVRLTWYSSGGTSTIVRYIESEFSKSPAGIGKDVFFGGGAATYEYLARKGALDTVNVPGEITNVVPAALGGVRLYDTGYKWFGAAISSFGIVFNQRVLEFKDLGAPRTWEDLAKPSYIDWIASGDPRSSGVVHTLYEVILQAYGFEKGYGVLCGIAGNVRAFDEGGNATPRAVGLGEAAAGGSIDFYAYEQVEAYGEENVGFVLPEDLTVIDCDPIAVLKGAPHRDLANAFVSFVLSLEGQKLWYVRKGEEGGPSMFGLNRSPIRPDIYGLGLPSDVKVDPYKFRTSLVLDYDRSQARRTILDDLFKATIFDVHKELRAAWRIVGPSGDGALLARFAASPVTEQQLAELAATVWNDAGEKARIMREWTEFALKKFRSVTEEE